MKKNTLFLFSLSFFCVSFLTAQATNAYHFKNLESPTIHNIESVVTERTIINQPLDVFLCDDLDGTLDGVSEFDLTTINEEVTTDSELVITYHKSQNDASNGTGAIVNTENYKSTSETIYVRAENILTSFHETTSFIIEVNLIPQATFDSKLSYEVDSITKYPIEIALIPSNFTAEEVSIKWYLDAVLISGESGLKLSSVFTQGDYSAVITFNSTGCQSNPTSVSVSESVSTVFPQGISPTTSPGLNDTFDLSSHNVTKLEIFNRHGIKVYSKSDYTNEWIGQTDSGEELPVGTYFYIMEYDGGTKKRSAWVYVNR